MRASSSAPGEASSAYHLCLNPVLTSQFITSMCKCVTWGWTEFLFREEVSKSWDLFFSVVWPKYCNCSQKHPEAGCRIYWLTLNHLCHPERWKGLIPSKPQTRTTALRMLWILSSKSCQLTVPSLLCLWFHTCSMTPCQLLLLHVCSLTASLSLDVFV